MLLLLAAYMPPLRIAMKGLRPLQASPWLPVDR